MGTTLENRGRRVEPTSAPTAEIGGHKVSREDEDTYPQSQSQGSNVCDSPLTDQAEWGPERERSSRRMVETLRRNVLPGWSTGRQKVDSFTQTIASATNISWPSSSSAGSTSALILVRFEDRKLGIKIGQVTNSTYILSDCTNHDSLGAHSNICMGPAMSNSVQFQCLMGNPRSWPSSAKYQKGLQTISSLAMRLFTSMVGTSEA